MDEAMNAAAAGTSVLVVINDQTPEAFGLYTAEILKAEGWNAFQVQALAALDGALLAQYPVVILTETVLTAYQSSLFRAYVAAGGRLVAFRPAPSLFDLFGIQEERGILENGYLQIDTTCQIGRGLTGETIQFHGPAQRYQLASSSPVARLYEDADTPSPYPAVVENAFGRGRCLGFAYNLPASIVLTRQGNPAWAGQERDGILGIRAAEMFLGWADPGKVHLNQADEQMRLLSHALEDFCQDAFPLPRLWYFPGDLSCLVLLTNDGEDSTQADFEQHFADVESLGAHMTLYLKGDYIPPATVARWAAGGHEIACHFDDTAEAAQPTFAAMQAVASRTVEKHRQVYSTQVRTVRNHWIVWVGWSEQAAIEAACGIGLDCNYYHYDQKSAHGAFLGPVGNFTGSGLPMKFADRAGGVLEIYQTVTQLPDEQWLQAHFYPNFVTLLDRSINQQGYSFITINCHTDQWQVWSRQSVMDMLAYARRCGVPVWTAENALHFLQARDAARFASVGWSGDELCFTLTVPSGNPGLSCLIPEQWASQVLDRVKINGAAHPFVVREIKGRQYGLIPTSETGSLEISAHYQAVGLEGKA